MNARIVSSVTVANAFEGGYREPRIPGLIALADGSLLLCYEARAEKCGDWGDIDIRVLKYKNGSFKEVFLYGESRLPKDGTLRTYNNPVLFDCGNGRVVLLFCKNYERCFEVESTDGGDSWGTVREITHCLKRSDYDWNVCATGPGHGAVLNGRLVCPVWYAQGEVYGNGERRHYPSAAGCIYKDASADWQCGFIVSSDKNASETDCAVLEGRLLFSFRNENPDRKRTFALSNDGGKTLLAPPLPALTDPTCFGGMCSLGKYALHVNNQHVSKRENLTLSVSENGFDWQELAHVADISGYADVYAVKDSIFVFYEETDYSRGMIGRLVLTELVWDK